MHFDAAIFDMDGVITRTASVHFTAWKEAFDGFLRGRREPFREFSRGDYLSHVDGRPRYEGVRLFLQSRGIALPYGTPSDDPERPTVCGLGNSKNARFNAVLARDGAEVFDTTIALIGEMRRNAVRVAVATSSRNCDPVLDRAGITHLFDARLDGIRSAKLGLAGKPQPDIFLAACSELQALPDRAVVVEDAVSGVAAGAAGGFGLVLGVARNGNADALISQGADLVVSDLSEISLMGIERRFESRRRETRKACSQ